MSGKGKCLHNAGFDGNVADNGDGESLYDTLQRAWQEESPGGLEAPITNLSTLEWNLKNTGTKAREITAGPQATEMEPSPEQLKQALQQLERQHAKRDDFLRYEGIVRDEGIGSIPFAEIQERIMKPENVRARRGLCYSHMHGGNMTVVGKQGDQFILLEGKIGNFRVNSRTRSVINEHLKKPGQEQVQTLAEEVRESGLQLPTWLIVDRHLVASDAQNEVDSSWVLGVADLEMDPEAIQEPRELRSFDRLHGKYRRNLQKGEKEKKFTFHHPELNDPTPDFRGMLLV